MRIAYDGTNYGGWQRQANHDCTVQQTVEEALAKVLGGKIAVTGCGRTDAGVHASQFYLYLRWAKPLPDDFVIYLNHHTPRDIAIQDCISVHDSAHVCQDATSRTYDYLIHGQPDVWLDRCSSRFPLKDFAPASLVSSLQKLVKSNQHRAFCLTPDRHHSTDVNFESVSLFRHEDSRRHRLRFVADRFLRGMIRILVKDLIAIGTGELTGASFERALSTCQRSGPVRLAPPEGLYLTGIQYPYLDHSPVLPLAAQGRWDRLLHFAK